MRLSSCFQWCGSLGRAVIRALPFGRCLFSGQRYGRVGTTAILAAVLAMLPGSGEPRAAEPLTVAAASSLHLALKDLRGIWQATDPAPLTLVFGSSGNLTRQIENGAPYDLFASADHAWIDQLVARGLIIPDSVAVYAEGVLALIVHSPDALTQAPAELGASDLKLLLQPKFRVIALANPAFAPYGVAAREALNRSGLWQVLQPRLVYGENVRQALTYVDTGNAEAALVAASLITAPPGRWRPLRAETHAPIRQTLGIVSRSPRREEARRFAALLLGRTGQAVLGRYGLRSPSHTHQE